ncbi:hypothetical protein GDO86_009674 [Hymenochirus boettgeri]|nr:hypothetical protein GDO86_009674 [Hymenochirus boettgeri]
MKKTINNTESLKLISGKWFEDLKSERYCEYSSATDLLKYAFHRERNAGLLTSLRKSWLPKAKFRSITKLESMFINPRSPPITMEREQESETYSPIPVSAEEMSITQILRDLDLILELEIKNNNSGSEIVDINGFGLENEMVEKILPVDYGSHQIYRYPGDFIQSKIPSNKPLNEMGSSKIEKCIPSDNNALAMGGDTVYSRSFPFETNALSSSEKQLFKEFSQNSIFQENDTKDKVILIQGKDSVGARELLNIPTILSNDIFQSKCDYLSSNSENGDCSSSDTGSTIEQPTLLSVTSTTIKEEDHLPTDTDW